jgi:hypothetical protein
MAGKKPPNNARNLRLEWRKPDELAENPRNWRTHPEGQEGALVGVLSEVGWAGACLYNEATGRLIDGHLRRKVASKQHSDSVPVLVGSWTEEQEKLILATLDPIAAMAEASAETLEELLGDVKTNSEAVEAMLEGLAGGVEEEPVECENDEDDEPRPASLPTSKLTFPPRVWLTQRDAIQDALSPIIESFGGTAEWAE